jgi:hypothetical protein
VDRVNVDACVVVVVLGSKGLGTAEKLAEGKNDRKECGSADCSRRYNSIQSEGEHSVPHKNTHLDGPSWSMNGQYKVPVTKERTGVCGG